MNKKLDTHVHFPCEQKTTLIAITKEPKGFPPLTASPGQCKQFHVCVNLFLRVTLRPARVQRPLLHAGHPGGSEPTGDGGEEGEKVQLQEEKGEAGETLQHQGGVARQVHPGDRGQAGDSEPSVGRALCVVSTAA